MKRPPRFVNCFIDRHGKPRFYFRRKNFKKIPLPGLPWSPEFMAAYEKALAAPRAGLGDTRSKPGSVSAAIAGYFASAAFQNLAPASAKARRRILENFRSNHGDKRIDTLEPRHLATMLDAMAKKPGATRNFLSAIRALMAYSVAVGLRANDPSAGLKTNTKLRPGGHYTWSEDDIAAFEARHPIGSRARLALALLLYSAQRRGDVLQLGRQHVRDGMLHIRQSKTGKALTIPVHPALRAVLDAMPGDHLTFLVSRNGRPFHPDAFTRWFGKRCAEAGITSSATVHGLRKAAARRLAEAGCSASVIASVTGHKSLREVQRYVEAADQIRLARQGIEAINGTRSD
jgi:integrase